MIFGAGEGVGDTGRATVDRGKGRSADIELGEGVEVNVDLVLRIAFALSFDLLGLFFIISIDIIKWRI